MKKVLLGGLLLIIAMSGCVSVARIHTDDAIGTGFKPTSAGSVKVYSTTSIDMKYLVIGQVIVSADAGRNAATAVDNLKEQAAALGADAILDLRLEIDQGYWASAVKASGIAVKFQ